MFRQLYRPRLQVLLDPDWDNGTLELAERLAKQGAFYPVPVTPVNFNSIIPEAPFQERTMANISCGIHEDYECPRCVKEKPNDYRSDEWSNLRVGLTDDGFQVWCLRHQVNVADVTIRNDGTLIERLVEAVRDRASGLVTTRRKGGGWWRADEPTD